MAPALEVVAGSDPRPAAGEALADKLPIAKPRSEPGPLGGRALAGGASGAALGGARGARIGATLALASTYPSERARALAGKRTGLPDPALAVVEGALVYGAAWLASGAVESDGAKPASADSRPGTLAATAAGLGAALIGTAATAQAVHYKLSGAEESETPREVGEKLLGRVGVEVKRDQRSALNSAMHVF